MANKVQSPAKLYVGLHFCILLFSFSGVFSKLASRFPTLSWGFLLCYGVSLFVCFVYAILWQQFLKQMPLNTAYSNRILTMVWSMVWGALFFGEAITLPMILGTVIILFGLRMVVTADA